MVDWEKVQVSHVIKTCCKVVNKWWGADISFFDEFGNCKVDLPVNNSLCSFLSTTESGAKLCKKNYHVQMKHIRKDRRPLFYRCFAGLDGVIVPIIVNEDYVGAIVCYGINMTRFEARQKEYIEKLVKAGFDREGVELSYKKLKNVNGHSQSYMGDFISLVAEDVIALFEALREKDNIIKRQTVLLERAYNNKYVGILGKSPVMKEIFDILELVESSESPLLIEGESGTGKELLAAAVHYNSSRRHKMFVIQNCSAFNETLLCSELFGHEKGSFTGAISDKKGLFELADGGTLFLDEIGDMDIGVQARLLRVLEGGTFYSVGGTVPKRVNVRIIAATNKVLKDQVDKGFFRKDLFYRINTLQITMPPLRERKEDVLVLADYFASTYADIHNRTRKVFDSEVLDYFSSYDWPGNVRELKNLVERLIIVSGKDELIELKHLPKDMRNLSSSDTIDTGLKEGQTLRFALQIVEKELIMKSLKNADWNKTVSSNELGISRASLNNKIVLLNIARE